MNPGLKELTISLLVNGHFEYAVDQESVCLNR